MSNEILQTPRWGNSHRDRKAAGILRTLKLKCGEDVCAGSWLDVGCGSGAIAASLAPYVDAISGIDPEPWLQWRDFVSSAANLKFNVGFFDGDVLPVLENSFDVVVCNQVYEHADRPDLLIQNIAAVLKPGGVCYFAGPNLLWPIEPHVLWPFVHWLPRRTAQFLMRILGSNKACELDAFSTHYFQLHRWFQAAGLNSENAVTERLAGVFRSDPTSKNCLISNPITQVLTRFLVPFLPGFVFILSKENE